VRVQVVGSGAREHALAWAIQGHGDVELICAPGNGGTAQLAENVAVAADDVAAQLRLATERSVDLVVIGPDAAVAAGLADACAAAGVPVFGPTAAAGRIESSKAFAKELMDAAAIPTARWREAGDVATAMGAVAELGGRCVVKADGLALGKGVAICDDAEQARTAVEASLVGGRFGAAGRRVVIEERLEGPEVSVFALSDGERVRLLVPACDYKRAHDGDHGPNTGGMGAVAQSSWGEAGAQQGWLDGIVQPCIDALRERGTPYRGCLYAGLMLTAVGPRVLEFNARFGDPETQVVLPLLAEDTLDLLLGCAHAALQPGRAALRTGVTVGVVAASAGYPGRVETGAEITGVDSLDAGALCFHAGTRRDAGRLLSAGGRVLTVVGHSPDLAGARRAAYANLDRISFDGMWSRRDIAESVPIWRSVSMGMEVRG